MSSTISLSETVPSTRSTVLLHADFLVTGIVMTLLGPMLPVLAARWAINDAQAGRLFLVQFVSSMVGMLASAPTVQRRGYRTTFIIGLVFMASGVGLLASAPYWAGMIAVGILGVGHGITTPAGNLRTAEVNPRRSASALNVINAVWGIGAMSPSFLLAIARTLHHPTWFLYGTSIALAILLPAFALVSFAPDTHTRSSESHLSTAPQSSWISPTLWLICVIFFLYVGAETSFGQWVATYAHRLEPKRSLWTLMPSFFYGALLAGRTLAPFALKFARETAVAIAGLIFALVGGLALLEAHGTPLIVVGSLLAGLGLASIFPISVSLLPRWFHGSVNRASGPVFAMGNMGGAVLPWVVGEISTHFSSLRLGFLVPLFAVAAMLTFYVTQGASATDGTHGST